MSIGKLWQLGWPGVGLGLPIILCTLPSLNHLVTDIHASANQCKGRNAELP